MDDAAVAKRLTRCLRLSLVGDWVGANADSALATELVDRLVADYLEAVAETRQSNVF